MDTARFSRFWRSLPWLAAFLVTGLAGYALAQQPAPAEEDPPSRVAALTHRQGSVVFAPQGEDEWVDLPPNRPLTAGDRLWSDRDARAELHLGSATLHVDGESHLGVSTLDDQSAQFILLQGSVNARVRELQPGENFEIDTPNIALRATQPGDFRLDVDGSGQTRVVVLAGAATVFGEGGESIHLGAGQHATFAGRFLAQVQGRPWRADEFAQWSAERNRMEDQSIAAQHVPRAVVGYQQLDQHGTWSQDATYGTVWYPQVATPDWAPYRYGRWTHIAPWGWTWVDDAPWGFAPFHYGRWAQIGPRWAWVPGRFATRPVYSPAMVVFLGGSGFNYTVRNAPSVGWYPLAPGEAWWPSYRSSSRYIASANTYIDLQRYSRNYTGHVYRQRPYAVTAVRMDDFRSGRRTYQNWQQPHASVINQAQAGWVPQRPERSVERGWGRPRLHTTPPAAQAINLPERRWSYNPRRDDDRRDGRDGRDGRQNRAAAPAPAPFQQPINLTNRPVTADEVARQQNREQREQRQREWTQRQQQEQAQPNRGQQEQQWRQQREAREQQQRAQQDQQQQQWRQQRERQQQDQAQRDQRQREWAQRQQQEQARQQQQQQAQQQQAQQQQQRAQQEQAWRQQREQQEQAQRQHRELQDRQAREWTQRQQQQQQPQAPQQQAAPVGRGERGDRDGQRGQGRGQRDDDQPGRGRGNGHGPWNRAV
jgi:hypothetical protein